MGDFFVGSFGVFCGRFSCGLCFDGAGLSRGTTPRERGGERGRERMRWARVLREARARWAWAPADGAREIYGTYLPDSPERVRGRSRCPTPLSFPRRRDR